MWGCTLGAGRSSSDTGGTSDTSGALRRRWTSWCALVVLAVGLTGCAASRGDDAARSTAVREVIAHVVSTRAAALRDADVVRWQTTVTDPSSSVGEREVEAFNTLRSLGVASLEVVGVVSVDPGGWPASARAVVDLGYAVPGVDRGMRVARRTIAITGGAAPTMTWLSAVDSLEVFDLGRLGVSRRGEVIVASAPSTAGASTESPEAQAWLDRVVAARSRVTDVFGAAPPVLVVVPAQPTDFARLVKRTTSDGSEVIAAVTEGARPAGVAAPADRVIVNPTVMARLSAEGMTVVLAHELTHVSLRGVPPREMPLWWSEGCAEWTAYRGVTVPVTVRWKAAIDRHRASSTWPHELPSDRDFDSSSAQFGTAYVVSELAVTLLVQAHGPDVCRRLAAPEHAIDGATSTGEQQGQLATSQAALVGEVRGFLAQLAAVP